PSGKNPYNTYKASVCQGQKGRHWRAFVQNVLEELGISGTSAWGGRHLPYLLNPGLRYVVPIRQAQGTLSGVEGC
ncbi:MAG: hypothetical protein Q8O60_08550, partial [Deltaproteobacteria bacterium]|nr:hypothetical protein [Deltaproteobacteria bacterium]